MTGHINVMLVLQSCNDSLHFLAISPSDTNAASSDCAYHIGNMKVGEDVDVKTEKGIASEEEECIGVKDEEGIYSEEEEDDDIDIKEEDDVGIKEEVSVESTKK